MSAVLVDRSARLRMLFSGEKAKESLGGLVTNDVVALAAGHGQRAVALTNKGRVIAWCVCSTAARPARGLGACVSRGLRRHDPQVREPAHGQVHSHQ